MTMRKIETTLCLLFKDDQVLLALKKRGLGHGNYNGVGGKVEAGETLIEAMIREVQEEINVTPILYKKVGEISFIEYYGDEKANTIVNIFIITEWNGIPQESEEMKPDWFNLNSIPYDIMFPDDRYWMPWVLEGKMFTGEFVFDQNWNLLSHTLTEVDGF